MEAACPVRQTQLMQKRPLNWLIWAWRKDRGHTQEVLGAKIGKTQGFISQLETGESQPSPETLDQLADALEIALWELMTRDPTDPSPMWSILDKLKKATPNQLEQLDRVTDALIRPEP
jgi:transcriptional regulator with XRE-family HTH domain